MEALSLLALARKTIVVGDDKQTSPEHVGLDRQQVFDLLDEHLAMIPKYRTLFDPGNAAMRRVNVAASRARQQMWVVHSVDPSSFPDGDLRGALIRHCRDAGTTTAPPANLLDAWRVAI